MGRRPLLTIASFLALLLFLVPSCGSGDEGPATKTLKATVSATAIPTVPPTSVPLAQIPIPIPTQTPTQATNTYAVGNTGGLGVYIRRTLSPSDRIRAWQDGALMLIVGADQQGEGRTWKNVKDPDGNVGFIPVDFLVPAPNATPKPSPMASPAAR